VKMKAHKFLENESIDFELVEQDNPTKDCDDAARERGVETSQIVKSLIVKQHESKGSKEGKLIHVLLPGDREISEKKFGEHHLISPEESEELTGFESGTVHPFATDIKHVIDYRTLSKEKVSFTVGETKKGVIINKKGFQKALDSADFTYKVKDVSLTKEEDIEKLKSEGLTEEDARFIADKGLTPVYLKLGYENNLLVKAFKEFRRHNLDINKSEIEKVIDASESLSNLQKIIEVYDEKGEIPENEDFNVENLVSEVFNERSNVLEDYKQGKDSVVNFVIGEVMKKSSGRANPEKVKEVLKNEY